MMRGFLEEIGRALGKAAGSQLEPLAQRFERVAKLMEQKPPGEDSTLSRGAVTAGIAAGSAVAGVVGTSAWIGGETKDSAKERLANRWSEYTTSCDELLSEVPKSEKPSFHNALHQELNSIHETLMTSQSDLDKTTTVHVGLGEIVPPVRPQSMETVNCLETALQKLILENLKLKHRLNDPSQGSNVLKNIDERWCSIWPSAFPSGTSSVHDQGGQATPDTPPPSADRGLASSQGACAPQHPPSSGPAIELQAVPPRHPKCSHWLDHLSDWWL